MSHTDHLKTLIFNHTCRLRKLKEKQALFGFDTPPHIEMEIDYIEAEISKLQAELKALGETYIIKEPTAQEIDSVSSSFPRHVEIHFKGDYTSLSEDRRSAAVAGFASAIQETLQNVEVHGIGLGSIVCYLGIPAGAAERLHSLLASNSPKLHALEIEKIMLERESWQVEEWENKNGQFVLILPAPKKPSPKPKVIKKTASNEATSVDLEVIDRLRHEYGWKPDDTLFYQPEYQLTTEQQKEYGVKSIKPDIVLTDFNGDVLAVFENKLEDEKKGLNKLRLLYYPILKPRFLYACSTERTLFYDTAWKGLDAGEFRQVDGFMTLEETRLKLEQERQKNANRPIKIDTTIAGGYDPAAGKERYYQIECIETLLEKYKAGKQKMLVHMATGLGKTRTVVALAKALLEYGLAKRVLFVVDRILLAEQALNEGFSLISKDFPAVRLRTSNYRQQKHVNIYVVVIDTLEKIYPNIPNTFFDLLVVDECHRSININRSLIFDHFLCPRIGVTATPKKAIVAEGKDIPDDDLAILDTYRLFGCETGEPDYQFSLERGIDEGFLAPYQPIELKSHLTQLADEAGIEFDYVLDPDERKKIELGQTANINLEQLDKKIISIEQTRRIAEEIRQQTEYGEKMILFASSQAHCLELVKEINRAFGEEELSPRYAEAIISENNELNSTLKEWFKNPNRKPYIVVSVDIMSTGVDVPCVRYISFATLTKSVSKYIQMIGRGTRLDPKTGKYSFKVLDFFGLCKRMEDNGKGTPQENTVIVSTPSRTGGKGGIRGSGGQGGTVEGKYFLIDNPDPANLMTRTYIHGDTVEVIDNIPIVEARVIFEKEVQEPKAPEVVEIKQKVERDATYEPSEQDIESLRQWMRRPEIYLDESQLQRIYEFQQGTLWDFFLHALNVVKLPTTEERVKQAFDSYLKTENFNDEQIRTLRLMREMYAVNMTSKKSFNANDIFSNPIYEQIIGTKAEINRKFEGRFDEIVRELDEIAMV